MNREPAPLTLLTVMSPPIIWLKPPGQGEAKAGAAIVARRGRVGLGEGLEQLADLLGAHADAGVGHLERAPSRRAADRRGVTSRVTTPVLR